MLSNLVATADPALLASLDERLVALAGCAGVTCRAALSRCRVSRQAALSARLAG